MIFSKNSKTNLTKTDIHIKQWVRSIRTLMHSHYRFWYCCGYILETLTYKEVAECDCFMIHTNITTTTFCYSNHLLEKRERECDVVSLWVSNVTVRWIAHVRRCTQKQDHCYVQLLRLYVRVIVYSSDTLHSFSFIYIYA